MGRHADGRSAGPPVLPPRSLLVALLAAVIVTAVILTAVALSGSGPQPTHQITDLRATPSPILSRPATPTPTATKVNRP